MATKKPTPPAEPDPTAPAEPEPLSPTVWIRNDSPRGALDVALLRRSVGRGEVIEVSREHAEILTRQDIWNVTDAPKPDTNSDGE